MTPDLQPPASEPHMTGAGLPPPSHAFLAAPDGYFDKLDAAVAARLQGELAPNSPLHNPILRRDWLAAPDGYFASLPSRVVSRVQALRRSLLPDFSSLLAPQNLRLALPMLLAGVMIGGGWWATRRTDAGPSRAGLAIRSAIAPAHDEVLLAINHELDGFDDVLLAESLAPVSASASTMDGGRQTRTEPAVDPAVEDYLARTMSEAELAEALLRP